MSIDKRVIQVKDSVTFTLNEADLTRMQVGEVLKTPERDVSHGLRWYVQWYPAGRFPEHANNLSVYLHVNKAVSAWFTFTIDRIPGPALPLTHDFTAAISIGFHKYATHEYLRRGCVNGKLSITCEVKFAVSLFTFPKPCLALYSDHVSTDFALVVSSNRVQVHKSLLSLMSPVFHAMLSHDTAESRSGEVEIKDFDFETIKTAIDYCYGRLSELTSVETVINILRFADKYDIKGVTIVLEKISKLLTVETFPALLRYADDLFKDDLFEECCNFFNEHQKEIVKTKKFATLGASLVERLLMQTFDLKTEFDVLRYAHANGITFILDPFEQPILESLSLDTFCDTVSYAWDCSRDNLKTACAEFFDKHLTEISNMKSFVNLYSSVVRGVMKLRCDILFPDK